METHARDKMWSLLGPECNLELVADVIVTISLEAHTGRDPSEGTRCFRELPLELSVALEGQVAGRGGLKDDCECAGQTIAQQTRQELDVVSANQFRCVAADDLDRLAQPRETLGLICPDEALEQPCPLLRGDVDRIEVDPTATANLRPKRK